MCFYKDVVINQGKLHFFKVATGHSWGYESGPWFGLENIFTINKNIYIYEKKASHRLNTTINMIVKVQVNIKTSINIKSNPRDTLNLLTCGDSSIENKKIWKKEEQKHVLCDVSRIMHHLWPVTYQPSPVTRPPLYADSAAM